MLKKFYAVCGIAIVCAFCLRYILQGDYGGAIIMTPFALAVLSPAILAGLYAFGLPKIRWLSCTFEIMFHTLIAALTILCLTCAISRAAMEWSTNLSLAVFCIFLALASAASGTGICYCRAKEALVWNKCHDETKTLSR